MRKSLNEVTFHPKLHGFFPKRPDVANEEMRIVEPVAFDESVGMVVRPLCGLRAVFLRDLWE